MRIKIRNYLNLFYYNIIILILSIFTNEVYAENKIIAKRGDTLFKISREYGVPLKELMYKNNFNDAAKIIEGEVIIIPRDKNNRIKTNKNNLIYKVIEGDTLYSISKNHNVKIEDIILLNNIGNDFHLSVDQKILLPKEARKNKDISKDNIQFARKKVIYHLTSKAETLESITKLHRITTEDIKTLNELNDPIKINTNIQLRPSKSKASKWRKYGSIIVNWSDWTYFDGNYFSQAKTIKNTSFYIAISCKKRTLNNTLNNPSWINWYFPKADFEFELINDFCDKEFNF